MHEFDTKSGRYRDTTTGKFVARNIVIGHALSESDRLRVRLQGHARVLLSNKISVGEFQTRVAIDLKLSVIRNTILGAGGKSNTTTNQYLAAGRLLKEQYQLLGKFGKAIADVTLSAKQIIQRVGQYSNAATTAYYLAEKSGRQRYGFKQAIRSLDSQSQHCEDCVYYATGGRWLSIDKVIPPGVDCKCGGNCRCRIEYRG